MLQQKQIPIVYSPLSNTASSDAMNYRKTIGRVIPEIKYPSLHDRTYQWWHERERVHSIFNDILLLIPNKSKWHCRNKHPMISLSGRSFLLFFYFISPFDTKDRSFGHKLEISIQWIDHGSELTLTLSPMAISWNCYSTDQVLFPLGNIIKRLAIKLCGSYLFQNLS